MLTLYTYFRSSAAYRVRIALNLKQLPTDHNDHLSKVQWPVWLRKRYVEGGIDPDEAERLTRYFAAKRQVDFLNCDEIGLQFVQDFGCPGQVDLVIHPLGVANIVAGGS